MKKAVKKTTKPTKLRRLKFYVMREINNYGALITKEPRRKHGTSYYAFLWDDESACSQKEEVLHRLGFVLKPGEQYEVTAVVRKLKKSEWPKR